MGVPGLMPDDWKKLQIPLGLIVAAVVVIFSAWTYLHSEFVHAADFRQYQQAAETRSLEREKKQHELEVLRLGVKREAYPARFDAVDKAILQKHEADLREINQEIAKLKAGK
jgi:hypothetical protein